MNTESIKTRIGTYRLRIAECGLRSMNADPLKQGLKPSFLQMTNQSLCTFNRTSMELKHKLGHAEIIPLLQEMIEKPYEIWFTRQVSETGRIRIALIQMTKGIEELKDLFSRKAAESAKEKQKDKIIALRPLRLCVITFFKIWWAMPTKLS